ncbi:hypothetical protein [Embleya sp. MST-111070]|uniref:hypothetical protein n=1 Tax=Embleya sp. MST-111070 TaxID=3398231 RepID=UPI003F73684C
MSSNATGEASRLVARLVYGPKDVARSHGSEELSPQAVADLLGGLKERSDVSPAEPVRHEVVGARETPD